MSSCAVRPTSTVHLSGSAGSMKVQYFVISAISFASPAGAYLPTEQVHPIFFRPSSTATSFSERARGKIRSRATSEILLFPVRSEAGGMIHTGCLAAGSCWPGLVGVVARSNMAPYFSSRARFFGFVVGVFFLPSLQYIHAAPRVPIGAAEEVWLLGAVTGLVGGFAGGGGFDTGGFFGGVFGVWGFLEVQQVWSASFRLRSAFPAYLKSLKCRCIGLSLCSVQ